MTVTFWEIVGVFSTLLVLTFTGWRALLDAEVFENRAAIDSAAGVSVSSPLRLLPRARRASA